MVTSLSLAPHWCNQIVLAAVAVGIFVPTATNLNRNNVQHFSSETARSSSSKFTPRQPALSYLAGQMVSRLTTNVFLRLLILLVKRHFFYDFDAVPWFITESKDCQGLVTKGKKKKKERFGSIKRRLKMQSPKGLALKLYTPSCMMMNIPICYGQSWLKGHHAIKRESCGLCAVSVIALVYTDRSMKGPKNWH